MKQSAKVIEVDGNIATVEVSRKTICEGCHKYDGDNKCSACLTFGDRRASAKAVNKIGAKVGDRVTVEAASEKIIVYSAVIFFMPIMIAFAVYVFTATRANSLIYTLISFVLSFAAASFVLEKSVKNKPDLTITDFESDTESKNETDGEK